ncbi:MAG: hypothetical protein HOV80_03235 [Polyangiaceae bacterium]|nr:hypothetical protein [Polyangiaceae bacterium]
MTASATPYRAKPRGRAASLAVYPLVLPRLLILVGVLATIVTLLHLFLWSRVVHIRCERTQPDRVVCDVDESSIVLSNRFQRDARGVTRVRVRGAISRSRGDSWLVLVSADEEQDLTSGFNGDKGGQRAAAEELDAFFVDTARSVDVSYGSRWLTAWIFLAVFGGLFVVTYPLFGYRVRVTIDRGEGTIAIDRGPWPLSLRAGVLPLATFTGFRVEGQKRFQLVATSSDQGSIPCAFRMGISGTLSDAANRLNAWVQAERERGVEG